MSKNKNIQKRNSIIIIAGATASSKSSLALDFISRKNNNSYRDIDIVKNIISQKNISFWNNQSSKEDSKKQDPIFHLLSVDSRQIYKDISLFSGISPKEKEHISFIGFLPVWEKFSAGQFTKKAWKRCQNIWLTNTDQRNIPIIVGGTSFYLKSLLYKDFLPQVDIDPNFREKLKNKTNEELCKMIEKRDPERFKTIDKNNTPRLIRALEIIKSLGRVPVESQTLKENLEIIFIWKKISREEQNKKIEKNFKERMKKGFLEEAITLKKNLENKNFSESEIKKIFSHLGLSYKHIFSLWSEEISREDFMELGIREEQKYAKRQNTYLKKFYNELPEEVTKITFK